jgi:hypothetical protein
MSAAGVVTGNVFGDGDADEHALIVNVTIAEAARARPERAMAPRR